MDAAKLRPLKIKTGVVKRLAKEKQSYEKEVVTEEERCEKLKASGGDEYQIRKQNEVIEESKLMIPDTNRKLKAAREDLSKVMDDLKTGLTDEDLAQLLACEEFKEATKHMEESAKVVS